MANREVLINNLMRIARDLETAYPMDAEHVRVAIAQLRQDGQHIMFKEQLLFDQAAYIDSLTNKNEQPHSLSQETRCR